MRSLIHQLRLTYRVLRLLAHLEGWSWRHIVVGVSMWGMALVGLFVFVQALWRFVLSVLLLPFR